MDEPLVKGINVVSIAVPDLEAARVFYGETLGLGSPIYNLPEAGWIEFSTGGAGGNLAITSTDADQGPNRATTIVLNTTDCKLACAALRSRGIDCDDPVVFPGFVTFFSFYDPFGNRLQMCSPAPDSSD